MNPFSSDVFEELGPMDDSGSFGGSFGGSWSDLHGDSCGFSECVPAVSSNVPVVTDVSVSPCSVGVLGEVPPSDSDCESVQSQSFFFLQKASSLPCGKSRRHECGEFARRRAAVVKKEDTRGGLRR